MYVEKTTLRNGEERRGKDAPVRDYDGDVRMQLCNRFLKLRRTDLLRLIDMQSELDRPDCYRRLVQLHSAPGRTIGLGDDEDNLVFTRNCFQCGDCEFGCAEEDDAQGDDGNSAFPALALFTSF